MSRIDPGISLQVKPPQTADPLESYGKILSLKNMMTRGRLDDQALELNQENIKGAGLKNQEEERRVKADQTVREAIQASTNIGEDGSFSIDHDKAEALITRAGYPDQALLYSKARNEIENTALDHITKTLTVQSDRAKKIGQMAQTVLGVPAELRPQVYGFTLKQAVSGGLVDQKTLQERGIPLQYEGPQTDALLQSLSDQGTGDNVFEQQKKRIEEKRAQQKAEDEHAAATTKLTGDQADALSKQLKTESEVLGAAKTPEDWKTALGQLPADRQKLYSAEFSDDARQRAAFQGLTPKERKDLTKFSSPTEMAYAARRGDKDAQAALDMLEKREIRIDTAKKMAELTAFGGTPGPGGAQPAALSKLNEDYLKTLNPSIAAQVKALAAGRMAFPSGFALKSPYWQAMMSAVAQYDPMFDATNYNQRAKLRQDFTTGDSAKGVNALTTVVQHLDRLDKSIDGLDNFEGVPLLNSTLNSVKNWYKEHSGNTKAINKFRDDVQAVVSEATRAWRGAGGSEKDIQDWKKNLNVSDSPSGLRSSLAEIGDLLEGKILAYKRQLDQGLGPMNDISIMDPKTEAVLNKLRGEPAPPTTPQPTTPGAKKIITSDIMQRARAANPGVDDETLMKAMESKGYAR